MATNTVTQITNGGLCREYREQYSYDPIAFIENSQKNKGTQIADGHGSATEKPTTPETPKESSSEPTKDPTELTNSFLTLRSIQTVKLTKPAIDFLRDWDIQIVAKTSDTMKVGQTGTLTLYVTKKGSQTKFEGALPSGFSLISSNNSIEVESATVNYIKNGEHTLTYKPITSGRAMVAISIGGQTLAVLSTTAQ